MDIGAHGEHAAMMTRQVDEQNGIQWLECDACGAQTDPVPLYEADLTRRRCTEC